MAPGKHAPVGSGDRKQLTLERCRGWGNWVGGNGTQNPQGVPPGPGGDAGPSGTRRTGPATPRSLTTVANASESFEGREITKILSGEGAVFLPGQSPPVFSTKMCPRVAGRATPPLAPPLPLDYPPRCRHKACAWRELRHSSPPSSRARRFPRNERSFHHYPPKNPPSQNGTRGHPPKVPGRGNGCG